MEMPLNNDSEDGQCSHEAIHQNVGFESFFCLYSSAVMKSHLLVHLAKGGGVKLEGYSARLKGKYLLTVVILCFQHEMFSRLL